MFAMNLLPRSCCVASKLHYIGSYRIPYNYSLFLTSFHHTEEVIEPPAFQIQEEHLYIHTPDFYITLPGITAALIMSTYTLEQGFRARCLLDLKESVALNGKEMSRLDFDW
jgi:hypothetical protein